MLGQRRKRRPNIKSELYKCLYFPLKQGGVYFEGFRGIYFYIWLVWLWPGGRGLSVTGAGQGGIPGGQILAWRYQNPRHLYMTAYQTQVTVWALRNTSSP